MGSVSMEGKNRGSCTLTFFPALWMLRIEGERVKQKESMMMAGVVPGVWGGRGRKSGFLVLCGMVMGRGVVDFCGLLGKGIVEGRGMVIG